MCFYRTLQRPITLHGDGPNRRSCLPHPRPCGVRTSWPDCPTISGVERYDFLVMRHAVISVGCSQFHSPLGAHRRWLLAHWHRTSIKDFLSPTSFLPARVGVGPKSLAEVLKDLEQHGIITKGRNRVTVVNPSELEKRTCRLRSLVPSYMGTMW